MCLNSRKEHLLSTYWPTVSFKNKRDHIVYTVRAVCSKHSLIFHSKHSQSLCLHSRTQSARVPLHGERENICGSFPAVIGRGHRSYHGNWRSNLRQTSSYQLANWGNECGRERWCCCHGYRCGAGNGTHLRRTAISFSMLLSFPFSAFLGMHFTANIFPVDLSSARTTSENAPL